MQNSHHKAYVRLSSIWITALQQQITQFNYTNLDMFPQYHSASCRREGGSLALGEPNAAAPAADSDWAILSWKSAKEPKSCLMSDPDLLRTAGAIVDATEQFITDAKIHNQ